mgnify:CR=1 FL=1
MKILIWSKDRAGQLDILINSIIECSTFTPTIDVIYRTSCESYYTAYQLLKSYHNSKYINYIEESSFRVDTLNSIYESDTVCLCTDDSVFFDKFDDQSNLANLHSCFSYRLGFNTTVQDIHNRTVQPALIRYSDNGETISWKWTEYNQFNNYGYPFGLDGHLYNSERLFSIIEYLEFNSTNELETQLFYQKNKIPETIASYKTSKLVNVPVNSITGVTRAGEIHSHNQEQINELFLKGNRFKYNLNSPIIGCHQEFEIIQN